MAGGRDRRAPGQPAVGRGAHQLDGRRRRSCRARCSSDRGSGLAAAVVADGPVLVEVRPTFETGGGMRDRRAPGPAVVGRPVHEHGRHDRCSAGSGSTRPSTRRGAASKATLGSLTRSNGLTVAPALNVRPGRNPGAPHVAPPSPERTKPMSVAPPSKKRPTWNVGDDGATEGERVRLDLGRVLARRIREGIRADLR